MSKMSELSQTLDDMIHVGEDLIRVANEIKDIFSETAEAEEKPKKKAVKKEIPAEEANISKTEETSEPKKIEFTDVRALLAEKSRAGHTAEIKALLHKYGAEKLSEIDSSKYAALMADAEVLGNDLTCISLCFIKPPLAGLPTISKALFRTGRPGIPLCTGRHRCS